MIRTMSQAPDMATFERLVKSRFRLRVNDATSIEIELAEFKPGSSQPSYEHFSLVFQAPAEAPSEQRIYELEHESTGPFELFLVPIGRAEGGLLYEAVFNRRIEHAAGGD